MGLFGSEPGPCSLAGLAPKIPPPLLRGQAHAPMASPVWLEGPERALGDAWKTTIGAPLDFSILRLGLLGVRPESFFDTPVTLGTRSFPKSHAPPHLRRSPPLLGFIAGAATLALITLVPALTLWLPRMAVG